MKLYYSGIGVNQEAFNGPDMPKPVDLMLTYADMDSGQRVWAFIDLCEERNILHDRGRSSKRGEVGDE